MKISQILLRDSSYSQKELAEELGCNGIFRTQSGISRILKKMNYSRKRLSRIPEERKSPRNIDLRQLYARNQFRTGGKFSVLG
jgi:arginine repressor